MYNYSGIAVMEIKLKKWGNSIGLRIPSKIAKSYGIDENTIVELTASKDGLILRKKQTAPSLDEILASIPEDFEYPDDVADFVDSEPLGREML